ncbi:spore coat protein [Cryobacterium sp. Sr8]|uniref:cytidylyltransferase domain-containing protein n=1 Tax=Cryobacterium sp. Sr8 TaxID=1259203 RepID=UPI0010697633|nr:NTP transferase domain-containing protein [Cryobacterium sp. Sr8]TFD81602.1 spore coat protein [Cryobacterium sp. Sr8]
MSVEGDSKRVVAVIQARMGSSRLPGKVLMGLGGRPVLEWVIRAARAASNVDDVIVATSDQAVDEPIVEFCARSGTRVVRGDEQDVLSRFIVALDSSDADAIVRLTSDCPLLDPDLIDLVVEMWRRDPTLDYVSTTLERSLPRGLDVELASAAALRAADDRTAPGHHRTHVTSSLYADGSEYSCAGVHFRPAFNRYRVTLDEAADAEVLRRLVGILGDRPPSWREITSTLLLHPEIVSINQHVEQKLLIEG